MIRALAAGLLAGYGIAIPVGAVSAYLLALTARTSWRIGACAALGVATADGLYALIATVGGSSLTHVIEPVMTPLRWLSAAVLVAVAARGARTAVLRYRERREMTRGGDAPSSPGRAYAGLLGITLANPITVVYFAALVIGGRTAVAPDRLEQSVFVLAAFAASASWQLLLAGGGTLLGRLLAGDRGRLATALASSTLIVALAVHLLVAP